MEDSRTSFVVGNGQKDDDKDKDQEAGTFISYTNQYLHPTVHNLAKDNNTNIKTNNNK